jgi:hypothetical protein
LGVQQDYRATKDIDKANPVQVRTAAQQFNTNFTTVVQETDLLPGDLLFYNYDADVGMDHVAMYVGNGEVVHAAQEKLGIIRETLTNAKKNTAGFVGFRRLSTPGFPLQLRAYSPVKLVLVDPQGLRIDAESILPSTEEFRREVAGELFYDEWDPDGDGDTNAFVTATVLKVGVYQIQVVPKPGASPSDTYSLEIEAGGTVVTLAKDVALKDVPAQGYAVVSDGTGISAPDGSAPISTATFSSSPNGAGWHRDNVTVTLAATDEASGSGVKEITYSATGAQPIPSTTGVGASTSITVTAEGQTTITFAAKDNAGNVEVAKTVTVKLDKTAPTTTASSSPPPNTQGWHNTDVVVTFAAADSTSGSAQTEYNLDGPGWVTYAAPIKIVAEGIHTLLYRSSDVAGNVESVKSLTVRLDKTVPEAVLQFDPATRDIVVLGRDALSGVLQPKAVLGSVSPVQWEDDEDENGLDEEERAALGPDGALLLGTNGLADRSSRRAELRTYAVADTAGNVFTLVVRVQRSGAVIRARIVSLQYGGGPVRTTSDHQVGFVWTTDRSGALRALLQRIRIGAGQEARRVTAVFIVSRDKTTLVDRLPRVGSGKRVQIHQLSGLVLIGVATDKGQLVIDLPGVSNSSQALQSVDPTPSPSPSAMSASSSATPTKTPASSPSPTTSAAATSSPTPKPSSTATAALPTATGSSTATSTPSPTGTTGAAAVGTTTVIATPTATATISSSSLTAVGVTSTLPPASTPISPTSLGVTKPTSVTP